MKTVIELLGKHPQVSDYKINIHRKESYELFFVKGKLETVRATDTCDREVSVYVEHDGCKGEAQFFVYPSTTDEQVEQRIAEAVGKALLIHNQNYDLPAGERGEYVVESNFADFDVAELGAEIAKTVFAANTVPGASLNAVEVFLTRHTRQVLNSRGMDKSQVSYDAMVEAIPTYNGESQSVELYEQYNFSAMDREAITREIAGKMEQVKARYEAVKPEFALDCPVVLNKAELETLFMTLAHDVTYGSVYTHANVFHKGDAIQKAPVGDKLGITMAGEAAGCVAGAKFDGDGLALDRIRIVEDGKVVNYYGGNRYGQYLGEKPTGELRCVLVDAGTAGAEEFAAGPVLEVISMSGLQVDLNNDYIGGEIRLACYRDGDTVTPVTGISISGSLGQVLDHIRFSDEIGIHDSYIGPEKAILTHMNTF